MRTLVSLACTAAALASLLDVSTAEAQPEVRDHRTSPAPGPTAEPGPRVYRRRPGPRFMLPLKVDMGYAGANTTRGWAPGFGMAVGVHWASLSPTPTQFDVGIGVFGALLGAPKDDTAMSNAVAYGGAYLEGGHTLAHGTWWRTWATGRAEYLGSTAFGEDHAGFGAMGRLSVELYASGVGIEPRGVFLGTYALGLYMEAGVRDVASDLGAFHVSGGLTFRTPLVFAP